VNTTQIKSHSVNEIALEKEPVKLYHLPASISPVLIVTVSSSVTVSDEAQLVFSTLYMCISNDDEVMESASYTKLKSQLLASHVFNALKQAILLETTGFH
jgi:hypothetical protein